MNAAEIARLHHMKRVCDRIAARMGGRFVFVPAVREILKGHDGDEA
jgi:hypothetical protein